MAGVVALLGPEGGAEGVDVAQGHGHGFRFQLAGNRQVHRALEEVLGVIDGAVLGVGNIVQVQGGHLEHLTRALTVRAGEDGRMHIGEAPLMEELMDGKRRLTADTERRVEGVGAGAQVGHGAQIVHAHLLFLLGIGGQHQGAGDLKAGVQAALGDLGIIGQFIRLENDLHRLIAAAVRQRNKADILRIAHRFGPAADGDFGTVGGGGRVQRYEFGSLHGWSTPLIKNNDCSYYSGSGPNCTVFFYLQGGSHSTWPPSSTASASAAYCPARTASVTVLA